MRRVAIPLAAVLAIAGARAQTPAGSAKKVDAAPYNDAISKAVNEYWASTPVLIADKLFGPKYSEGREKYTLEQTRNSQDAAELTVTVEGLPDDSVAGERRRISFRRENGAWIIQEITVAFKCQKGRGHVVYSGAACK